MAYEPLVSVVMPTKNRAAAIAMAVASLFNGRYTNFELLVVDQSNNTATSEALSRFMDDPRFHYRVNRRPGVGAPSSRNIGLALSNGELLVMVDDDVTMPVDWLERIVAEFAADPAVEVVIGRLTAPPYDRSTGYIPEFYPHRYLDGWRLVTVVSAANIALRRSLLERIGGYDELVGPGGRFGIGDDSDFALRMLQARANWKPCPEIEVIHTHGFRPHGDGEQLKRDYQNGIGAVFGRAARRGYSRPTLWYLAREARRSVLALVDRLRGRPEEWVLVRARLSGFLEGLLCSPHVGHVGAAELAHMRQALADESVPAGATPLARPTAPRV